MQKEEIINLASKAGLIGFVWTEPHKHYGLFDIRNSPSEIEEALQTFARLIIQEQESQTTSEVPTLTFGGR